MSELEDIVAGATRGGSESGGGSASQAGEMRVCPLLSLGLISGVGKSRTLSCIGADCAWWNRKAGRCAVAAGFET
jgi:hypothetical protein